MNKWTNEQLNKWAIEQMNNWANEQFEQIAEQRGKNFLHADKRDYFFILAEAVLTLATIMEINSLFPLITSINYLHQ